MEEKGKVRRIKRRKGGVERAEEDVGERKKKSRKKTKKKRDEKAEEERRCKGERRGAGRAKEGVT